jgi:hypothetical protein
LESLDEIVKKDKIAKEIYKKELADRHPVNAREKKTAFFLLESPTIKKSI